MSLVALLTQRSPAHLPSGGGHSVLALIVLIQLVAQIAKAVKSQLAVFQQVFLNPLLQILAIQQIQGLSLFES